MVALWPSTDTSATPLAKLKTKFSSKHTSSVDHTQFAVLNQDFKTPQDVTQACISCHNKRHTEVMATSHWNWSNVEYVPDKGLLSLGKSNILNNFCVGVSSNEQSCTKCHIGYGYKDKNFNFKDPRNVDCLACHDNSNTYVKGSGQAGLPDKIVNLKLVATHVGRPERANCGTCHFNGGGGNNVKHGDMEQALYDPSPDVDIHMTSAGSDMSCVDCHSATNHQMLGKVYSLSSANRDRVQCESCHTELPHNDSILNNHTLKVACQTCHIPVYAKENPTKTYWDWSTAGKLKDGKPYEVKNPDGTDSYLSIKGSFQWGKNLQPEYTWFNGTATHYLLGDKVSDPSKPIQINTLLGSYDEPDSKIIPVKVMRSNQMFDEVNKYLIQPKTFSAHPGDGGFWKDFNWQTASAEGMKSVGLNYSGKMGFVKTEMYWPINHMVSKGDKAVACSECHTRNGGRLKNLKGFYMPGRDQNDFADLAGKSLILLTLIGVLTHGLTRMIAHKKGGF